MLRRLLSAIVLSLPLVAAGLVPLAPARAEGTPAETGIYLDGRSTLIHYGESDSLNVRVISETGVPPDGTVSVEIDGQPIGGGTLSPTPDDIPASEAVVPLPLLEPGDYEFVLSYAGNERFAPSTYTYDIWVDKTPSALALATTPEWIWAGERVTLTATVDTPFATAADAATPSGTVTFRYNHTNLAVRPVGPDGTATLTTTDLPAGLVDLVMIYSGDSRYDGDYLARDLEVHQVATTTELSVTPAPATYGDNVRIEAVVRADVTALGAPTSGSVTFRIDGHSVEVPVTPVGDPGDGVSSAVLERADLAVGTHTVGARFTGTAAFVPSTAANPGPLVVTRRTTTLTAAPVFLGLNPWLLPKAVLRATLTGNGRQVAGYPVTFTTGKTLLCTATTDAQGVATCDANAQRLGLTLNGGYVAAYSGDANNTASSARGNLIG